MKHNAEPACAALLQHLDVLMVKPRFPENIGMAARAMANMGAGSLLLAQPERWDTSPAPATPDAPDTADGTAPRVPTEASHTAKARRLSTPKGEHILQNARVFATVSAALTPYALVVGTTARIGGWRREIATPEQAAHDIVDRLAEGERVALVFGPEDRGLENDEIACCQRLVTIPTAGLASLNVAQALLVLLYECRKAALDRSARPQPAPAPGEHTTLPHIHFADQERLFTTLKETLLALDFLHGNNPDYFLLPLRRFLGRSGLRRHEYDALMGVCRQIRNKIK